MNAVARTEAAAAWVHRARTAARLALAEAEDALDAAVAAYAVAAEDALDAAYDAAEEVVA